MAIDKDLESCGSRAAAYSSSQAQPLHHRQKFEVYNEVLRRIQDFNYEEASLPGFDDQLWLHFNRLPARFLNTLAFSKIMKKYDKVASRNTLKQYMKMVDDSCFGCSDEVTKLIERVESTFIKHFSNSNRQKGMAVLRPKPKIERHRITFFLGCFAGCTLALTLALILILRPKDIMNKSGRTQYMDNIFPLYSLFGFECRVVLSISYTRVTIDAEDVSWKT